MVLLSEASKRRGVCTDRKTAQPFLFLWAQGLPVSVFGGWDFKNSEVWAAGYQFWDLRVSVHQGAQGGLIISGLSQMRVAQRNLLESVSLDTRG